MLNLFMFPSKRVLEKAKDLDATPFDIPNVEYTHYGDECTFDYIVQKYKIKDEAIKTLSVIVRGADWITSTTGRFWKSEYRLNYTCFAGNSLMSLKYPSQQREGRKIIGGWVLLLLDV